jgi:carbamoyltransferase
VPYPHSLGLLYGALTEYLGFEAMHDEYKVMGLAAYGEDRFRGAFDRLLTMAPGGRYALDLSYFGFHTHGRNRWYHDRLTALFGTPPRRADEPITAVHRDIACSLQRSLERVGLSLAEHARGLTKTRNLCLAGGVAQNVCMNARLREAGLFAEVFVPPAPGDAGTSHGAIQAIHARQTGRRPEAVPHAYLGPRYSRAACMQALARRSLTWREVGMDTRLLARTLADGKLVGVYQGAMEFGPRALGARSILADPRRVAVRDHLNATIKRREGFRPFAPAVPAEHAAEFFQWEGSAPFMSFVARVRPEKAEVIPAVVHVDHTARLQTVRREDNPFFWQLLTDFGELTGVPVLLNTSFNENEPIVCSPDEAVACFERTPLDALFMEGLLVVRSNGQP